ncbi:hypothetical protein [Streptomyces fractus]|uniref:DUF7848 domain-containing protein n=1 Tax=Streptomyces fractus TaxID=641806 RepID=UPI003CE934C2
MTRSIVRKVRWHIGPDASEGAPQAPTVVVWCTTCLVKSGRLDHATDAPEEWAQEHVSKHPSHTGYRYTLIAFWRATPMDADVVAVEPPKVDLAQFAPSELEP